MLNKIKIENSPYTLAHNDFYDEKFYKAVSEKKKAKYIGEFSLKTKNGSWADIPVAVFYQEDAHPQGSNYFGLYKSILPWEGLMITDAIKAVDNIWTGVLNPETNEVLYSAYQHDYQVHGDLMADGGACYTRSSKHPLVTFKIDKDKIILWEDKKNEDTKNTHEENTTSD